jgi:hypothetical protein
MIHKELDLQDISDKWLRVCGPCDGGLTELPCAHPDEDYRSVIWGLICEVRYWRSLGEKRFE